MFLNLSYPSGFIKNTADFLLYTSIFPELYNICGIPLILWLALFIEISGDTTKTVASESNCLFPSRIGCIVILPVFITVAAASLFVFKVPSARFKCILSE